MNRIKLMSHLVAGFPTDEIAFEVASALVRGGAEILEIQLPFSDPSADGPAIQAACTEVLKRGYRTKDGLAFIKKVHDAFPEIPVYIMSYASLVYTPGVENFCRMASESGVSALIIPDLPFDHDENLTSSCRKFGMENIPVAAPSMEKNRLHKLATAGFPYIYAALRAGITGSETKISDDTIEFLKNAGEGGSRIFGGFGITNGEQSAKLSSAVEGVVAGSVFVRLISEFADDVKTLSKKIEEKAKEITHS